MLAEAIKLDTNAVVAILVIALLGFILLVTALAAIAIGLGMALGRQRTRQDPAVLPAPPRRSVTFGVGWSLTLLSVFGALWLRSTVAPPQRVEPFFVGLALVAPFAWGLWCGSRRSPARTEN